MTKNEDVYGTVREAVAAHRIPCQVDDGQECIRAKQQRDELLAAAKVVSRENKTLVYCPEAQHSSVSVPLHEIVELREAIAKAEN